MSLKLRPVCMETVSIVTPVTYQMHSQVLGFLCAMETIAQYSCNEICVVKWRHKRQHVYRTAKPFPW